MAAAEFRATLDALDLAQCRVARWFGIGARSVRRWQRGDRRIPAGVAIIFCLLAAGTITADQIEEITAPPARTNGHAELKPPKEAAVPLASLASLTLTNGGAESEPRAPLDEEAPEQSAWAHAKTAALAVLMLSSTSCRWPHNDPQSCNFYFCGAVTERGPYCEHHRCAAHLAPRTDSRHGTGFLLQERYGKDRAIRSGMPEVLSYARTAASGGRSVGNGHREKVYGLP